MLANIVRHKRKPTRFTAPVVVAALALIATVTSASATGSCVHVAGYYEDRIVTDGCNSASGVCFAGDFYGGVNGDFTGAITSFVPTADTPATNVVFFTAGTVLHAKVSGRQGDLLVKNAGAYQAAGEGNVVDIWSITAGTGQLTGAAGVIRSSGVSDPLAGAGRSAYEGAICLP